MTDVTKTPATREAGGLVKWDPFGWMTDMEADMERWFGERWPMLRPIRGISTTPSAVMPRVDVFEQNSSLVIKAELPGVKKEDISVTADDGSLVIKGTRKEEKEVKEDQYYRMERSSGSYYRRIPLPEGTKTEQVTAEYKDGVLEVKVPKPAPAQPAPTMIAVK